MLTGKITGDLVQIALSGGSLIVDGGHYVTGDLVQIALAGRNKGATLTIHNSNTKVTGDLVQIALANPGKVTFA